MDQNAPSAESPRTGAVSLMQSAIASLTFQNRILRLSQKEVMKRLIMLKALAEHYSLENEMFIRYFIRIKDELETPPELFRTRSYRLKSIERKVASNPREGLTAEQKCYIVQFEIDEYRRECLQLERESKAAIELYTMKITALGFASEEVAKNKTAFEKSVARFVRMGSNMPQRKDTNIAKFLLFHKSSVHNLDTLIQNLQSENAELRKSRRKLRLYAREFEDLEFAMDAVDVEYTQISCDRALRKLRDLHTMCIQVRAFMNKVGQILVGYKTQLKNELAEGANLEQRIGHSLDLIKRIKSNIIAQCKAHKEEKTQLAQLQEFIKSYRVPDTEDYISKILESAELTRKHMHFTRKKSLAELKLKRHRNIWCRIKIRRSLH